MGAKRSEAKGQGEMQVPPHPQKEEVCKGRHEAHVGPKAQPRGSSEKELGQEESRPTFLDGAGEQCRAKGGGWPVEKLFAASDPSSCQ